MVYLLNQLAAVKVGLRKLRSRVELLHVYHTQGNAGSNAPSLLRSHMIHCRRVGKEPALCRILTFVSFYPLVH